jgi:hypothetical protein
MCEHEAVDFWSIGRSYLSIDRLCKDETSRVSNELTKRLIVLVVMVIRWKFICRKDSNWSSGGTHEVLILFIK